MTHLIVLAERFAEVGEGVEAAVAVDVYSASQAREEAAALIDDPYWSEITVLEPATLREFIVHPTR